MQLDFTFLLASGGAGLPTKAPELFRIGEFPVSNSVFVVWIVALAIIFLAQAATRNIKMVPEGLQNFWEFLIEGLLSFLEPILGHAVLKKTFWFFATIFIVIISTNIFALFPGVGTIGMGHETEHGFVLTKPFLRGANADVTVTMAMSIAFFLMWIVWSFQFNGVKGVFNHIFGSKANMPGIIGIMMVVMFFAVGVLEVVSICVRPVALTFRLYGNIFGGEAMIHTIESLAGYWSAIALIPVYLFELMVALVQALVFCLLTAVFTGMMCKHDEGAHH